MNHATQHAVVQTVVEALRQHKQPVTPATVERIAYAANLVPAPADALQAVKKALLSVEQAQRDTTDYERVLVVADASGAVRQFLMPKIRSAEPVPVLTPRQKFEQSRPFGSPSKEK